MFSAFLLRLCQEKRSLIEWNSESDTSHGSPALEPGTDSATKPLKAAIRRARVEAAERSDVMAELRGAEIARLEMLRDALDPVLREVPADVDFFDAGIMPADHPRLFIDMIGFIEMGRDRRLYRFVQDTQHGRVVLAESEKIETMVKAVTDYIARRLVEREKALAADTMAANAALVSGKSSLPVVVPKQQKSHREFRHILGFTIDLLGSMLLFTLIAAGCYYFLILFSGWAMPPHKN